MKTHHLSLTMKVINNLKLSQWIYNNFESLNGKEKSRMMLFTAIIAVLFGFFNGSIAHTEELLIYNYGCDSLRYIICYSSIEWNYLSATYERWAIKLALKLSKELDVKIALVIDDTLVKKDPRSKRLAVGGKKKNIVGFSLLTAVLVIGHITIPLVPQLCFRKAVCEKWEIDYVPKTDMALETIKLFIKSGLNTKRLVLIMDCWYTSNKMLNFCQSIPHLKYVLGIKSNRNVDKHPVENLKYGFRYKKAKSLSKKGYNYYLCLRPGKLNGIKDKVNVLLSKRENKITHEVTWRYFVTNMEGELAIFEWIGKRWQIETFHQIFKHRFEPENWRVHGIQRLTNMLILATMSMGFAFKYFLDHNYVQVTSMERRLEHNTISESLNYIRASLIPNEALIKNFIQTRL